jgi:hypothetical protein
VIEEAVIEDEDDPLFSVPDRDKGWVRECYQNYLDMIANPDDAVMAVDLDRILIEEGISQEDLRGYPPRLYEAQVDEAQVVFDETIQLIRTRIFIGEPDMGKRVIFAWDDVEQRWEKIGDSRQS